MHFIWLKKNGHAVYRKKQRLDCHYAFKICTSCPEVVAYPWFGLCTIKILNFCQCFPKLCLFTYQNNCHLTLHNATIILPITIPIFCYPRGNWLNFWHIDSNPLMFLPGQQMFLIIFFSKVFLQYLFSKTWFFSFTIMPYLSNEFRCIQCLCITKSQRVDISTARQLSITNVGLGASLETDLKSNGYVFVKTSHDVLNV